jgi:hypothetical protein
MSPELPGDIAAHGESAQSDRLENPQGVEQAGQIVGELAHGDLVVLPLALTKTAQIRR